jgi:hyaluronoglucosaminidase
MNPAGVIEGFFGKPWSWEARKSGASFLRESGYQFYIYAPKADPFLRRRWQEPLPADTVEHLRDLSAHCRRTRIAFGIGLTPFEIYLNYDANARDALRAKVQQINEVGVDWLCILFDDMRGDVDNIARLQGQVIEDICSWSSAGRFIICPTYYSYDHRLTREFGPPPKEYLHDLGRIVDPAIDFFWTGEKVISEGYSVAHLDAVAADIGRKPFIWDNYISNDSKIRTNHLYLDPTVGAWELPEDKVAGLAINPMNQPYLTRIALCGYQHLLKKRPGAHSVLPEVCQELCGSPFSERLLTDLAALQSTGLSKLDADQRNTLLGWYEAQAADPYAQEIAGFLRGEYVFDPQCLTT